MAVDTTSPTDIASLLKNVDLKQLIGDSTMADSTSGIGMAGGTLGAVLIGALLPRLLGDNNGLGTAATAAALTRPLDASDVNTAITNALNGQTLGNVQGEIWKAEGNVQTAISQASNVAQLATLNAEIASLQGQGDIKATITASSTESAAQNASIVAAVNQTGWEAVNATTTAAANIVAAGNTNTAALLSTTNALASQAATNASAAALGTLQGKYDTLIAIANDGGLTRTAIAALAATLPNARELDLQRQLTVALDDHRHTETRGRVESGNVSVITNVAQSQAQAQQQQQQVTMNGLLGQLIAAQHATNTSIVNGNGNRSNQTATNVGG